MRVDAPKHLSAETCRDCWKPATLCVCEWLSPLRNKKKLLILQHPQEAKEALSTGRLLSLSLENCAHRVGLSWASLEHALGQPADSKRWAVLYVGSRKQSGAVANPGTATLWKRGKKVEDPHWSELEGVILLDGNWKQSKSLWWRNAWLNRLPRLILKPASTSSYHVLRKQPRGECLCTMEAAAETLNVMNESKLVTEGLHDRLRQFIEAAKAPRIPTLPVPSELHVRE